MKKHRRYFLIVLKKDKMLLSKLKANEAFKELDKSVNNSKTEEAKS